MKGRENIQNQFTNNEAMAFYFALKEFVDRRKQLEIIDIFGKMDPDPDYDYKKGRTR